MINLARDNAMESRLFGAILAFEVAKDMFTGGLWIMSEQSITGKIAQLSTYPTLLASVWIFLSFLVIPYFVLQAFGLGKAYTILITRTACRAILFSGVIWCYLAFLSRNLDYGFVTEIFILTGGTCIAMSAVLANNLNSRQRRALEGDV